jgi:hypothetical protein
MQISQIIDKCLNPFDFIYIIYSNNIISIHIIYHRGTVDLGDHYAQKLAAAQNLG